MKYLIIMDAEGCINYSYTSDTETKIAMCREISVIIEFLSQYSDSSITVVDAHADGHNLDEIKSKYKHVKFVHHIWSMNSYQYDKAIIIGMHTKSGSSSKIAHSFRQEIKDVILGNRSVGECEIIVNWLAYFHIPVIFISGESLLKNEIQHLKCHFHSVEENEAFEISIYYLIESLKEAISMDINNIYYYNDSHIKVILDHHKYYPFISKDCYDITDEGICFNDTYDFIENALSLSLYIDLAKSCLEINIKRIGYILRKNKNIYENKIKDSLGDIMYKDTNDLSIYDIQKVLSNIKDYLKNTAIY